MDFRFTSFFLNFCKLSTIILFFHNIFFMHNKIQSALSSSIDGISFPEAQGHHKGKVRESFILDDARRAIVVSDRISAFDFVLGTVPFKGQVLNQIAAWWFRKLDGIVPHHLLDVPDPNISLVKNAQPLPVEIIVRGYLTGSTKTSSWYAYQHLDRKICGIEMPEGMKKNQKFAMPIITPTTKPTGEGEHDENISSAEVVSRGLVDEKTWKKAQEYAMKMFTLGQKVAAEHGLILVDTKYEMGMTTEGELIVIDEVHTPDSSRYWIEETYENRFSLGMEPEALSKEFVRTALVDKGYDVDDASADPSKYLDDDLRAMAAEKYIELYERVTGESFVFPAEGSAVKRIEWVLQKL
jgi:phosphoribosylaminoimidazole-succinocarboxamide synthase